jgi:pimeloyl-ACP methyl ester carboxylesterase
MQSGIETTPAGAGPLMLKRTVPSFDGRPLNVFHTAPRPRLADLVLVLPFGVRHQIADRLYPVLAADFNVITWESRFVLDLDADAGDASIEADTHARDMVHIIEQSRGWQPGASPQVDVLGYCSGAGVALLAAARHARLIRRLALVSGEYMLPAALCRQSNFQREVDLLLPAAATGMARARMLAEKIAGGRRAPGSEFDAFVSLPFSSAEHLHRYGLNYLAYRSVDFMRVAEQVRQPALLVAALDDRQVGVESSILISSRLPGASGLKTVDGDHYELCRGKQAMTRLVSEFFLQ